ncbi:MAG: sulfotransferase [Hyphomicrobiaceae bacterium]|nr:sulfotransferase [Hyphomicrobiaceae bacterium]
MNEQSETKPSRNKRWKMFWKKVRAPMKVHREGGWLLYFWHGMGIVTWFRLLARGRFDVTLNCLPNILTVTIWAPFNSLFYIVSELIYGVQANRHKIEDAPVFVLGHWRSGTTYLHDLLACDPEHGYPTTYQCFFPNHFLLTGGAVRKWFNVFLPKRRPMDNVAVGVDRPQEDEFAFANLGMGTHYVTLAWPRHGPQDMAYLDLVTLSDQEREAWEREFLWFIKRLSLKQKKRLVMKSPAHTARIRTLLKLFPDAKFIHISRNPLAIYPSTVKLWKALDSVQGLHNPANDDPWMEEFVFSVFDTVFKRYEEDKDLIPEGHLVEIRYEDLAEKPEDILKSIYEDLSLGDYARVEGAVKAYLSEKGVYTPNVFELPDKLRAKITKRWAGYIKRFGYETEVGTAR